MLTTTGVAGSLNRNVPRGREGGPRVFVSMDDDRIGQRLIRAGLITEKIRSRVEQAALLTGLGYEGTLTLSIGVSQYQHETHFETLVGEADQALYASKRASKNCVRTTR